MIAVAQATDAPTPQADPTCSHFHALCVELQGEAKASGDAALAQRVDRFLAPYWGTTQTLPRAPLERLEAQRILRRVLIARKCYGLVYGWYEAFKSPFGDNFEANLDMYVTHLRAVADGFAWISGYDTVLECGCGPESIGLVLARQNKRWIASDIYLPDALDRLKKLFEPVGPFEFQQINGVSLDGVPDASVDLVVSRSFFEHLLLEDAQEHLRQAFRVLRSRGQFVCLVPAGIGPPSDVTQEFPEFDAPEGLHIKEYRVRELTRDLKAAGFRRVRSRFLRVRGLGNLPAALNRRNEIPIPVAGVIESIAKSTWPASRRSPAGRRLWKKVWGHLGATPLLLIATKD